MNPNAAVGILSVVLILGGLCIIALSRHAGSALLTTIFWWIGLLVAVLGGLLILDPAIHWIATQLRAMLGL